MHGLVTNEEIQALSRRIAQEFHPERIILFGSYAYGKPKPSSDVDLLVVLPFEGNPLRQSAAILRRTNPRFLVDLIAETPERLRQRLEWEDFFLREITEKGKILYEAVDE